MTSTVLTIRASRNLESAQQAWSKILNLPGNAIPSSANPTARSRPRMSTEYTNRSIDVEPVQRIFPAQRHSKRVEYKRPRIVEVDEETTYYTRDNYNRHRIVEVKKVEDTYKAAREETTGPNRRIGRHYRPDSLPGPYRRPGLPHIVAEQQHHRQHRPAAQQEPRPNRPGHRRVRFDV